MKRMVLMAVATMMVLTAVGQTRKTTPKRTNATEQKTVAAKKLTFDMTLDIGGTLKGKQGEEYFVVQMPGKKASKIYEDVLFNVSRIYNHPEKVAEKVEGRSIVINGYAGELGELDENQGTYDVKYRIEMQFKDGRMRVNIPTIMMIRLDTRLTDRTYTFEAYELPIAVSMGASSIGVKLQEYMKLLLTALVYGTDDDNW
jgi:hypothetical protein